MMTVDEALLISELKRGSTAAFDRIYMLYFKRLYAYCLKFTHSEQDSEEIVHNVFLRLWRIRENIRQEDTVCALLFIISKSYLIKYYYRHKHKRELRYENYEKCLDILPDQTSADSVLIDGMYKEIIQQELEKMSERQRTIIVMSKFKALSNRKIAEILSLSEQTVKNQLSLGLKELKRRIRKRNII